MLFPADEFVLRATKNSQGRRVKFNLIDPSVNTYDLVAYLTPHWGDRRVLLRGGSEVEDRRVSSLEVGGSCLWGALCQHYYYYSHLTCKEIEVCSLKKYVLSPVLFQA